MALALPVPRPMARVANRNGFTRVHATGFVWIGWTVAGATALASMVVGFAAGAGAIGSVFGLSGVLAGGLILAAGTLVGLGLGMPFIVAGALIRIALDQRRLLAEQGRTLRRIRRSLGRPPRPRPAAPERARLVNRLSPR